jgi:hypothetical protein
VTGMRNHPQRKPRRHQRTTAEIETNPTKSDDNLAQRGYPERGMVPRNITRVHERKRRTKASYMETNNEKDRAKGMGGKVDRLPDGHTRQQDPNPGTARESS